jgi:hypothetical protein
VKGQHLVIGVIAFTLLIVAAIYFFVMAEFNRPKDENKVNVSIESIENIMQKERV